MKTLILIVSVSLLTGFLSVKAQSKISYGFGVKGGMTMSRFMESTVKNNYWFSYATGLSVEQRFTERLSLSYDLLYSRQGNVKFFSNPGLYDRIRTKYDYLTLPISFRYRLKRYPLVVIPGLQAGYLLSTQSDFLPKTGKTYSDETLLKNTDFGFSLGLGYRFGKHFFADAKYYQSFGTMYRGYSRIDPRTGSPVRYPAVEQYNQVISASLTYYPFVK